MEEPNSKRQRMENDDAKTRRLPSRPNRSNGMWSLQTRDVVQFDALVTSLQKVCKDFLSFAEKREVLFSSARQFEHRMKIIINKMHEDDHDATNRDLDSLKDDLVRTFFPEVKRAPAKLRNHGQVFKIYETFGSLLMMRSFFDEGRLFFCLDFRDSIGMSDEAYVGSAIGAAHQLRRYAVDRATVGDVSSVALCRDVVRDLLKELLEFDFRNGGHGLRRRYDSIKYVVRKFEDMLYEMSMTGSTMPDEEEEEKGDEVSLVDSTELRAIAKRMSEYDAKRELVIKKSRDVLKSGKKAIYALHRGDAKTAQSLLNAGATCAKSITEDYLDAEPLLRGGSFGNAMEEWAEARLFRHWLRWAAAAHIPMPGMLRPTALLLHDEMVNDEEIYIEFEEYLGGLIDLTGEIGRWAVARASKRDEDGVRRALATCRCVRTAVLALGHATPQRVRKKSGDIDRNISKLENILYELSLLSKTGRRTVHVEDIVESSTTTTAGGEERN